MPKKEVAKTNGNIFKTVVRGVVRDKLAVVRDDLERHFDEKLEELEIRLDEKLEEKIATSFTRIRDEIFTMLDKVMGELKAIREEFTAHQGQHDDLTQRIEKLDAIHPQGQHAG